MTCPVCGGVVMHNEPDYEAMPLSYLPFDQCEECGLVMGDYRDYADSIHEA